MSQKYEVLTEDQADHFLEKGHVVLKNCFPRSLAKEWREFTFKRLGYDENDPSTWEVPRIHLPSMNSVPIAEVAPKAIGAIRDLLGGEDRLANPNLNWYDGFIINFSAGADRDWQPPSAKVGGWHKDGDFFRHFLDSPEQGLLTIVIWSDILPKSGGTFVACDSVKSIAKYLADHPEGLLPSEAHFGKWIDQCEDFIELTGEAGDFVLIHPYVLHAASQNPSGRARFITNPPVSLKEPMNFNREDPDQFSLVERGVLRGLGVDRYDFKPTASRERVTPDRVRRQREMLDEHKKRLGIS